MPVWIGSGSTNNWNEAANWGTDGVATGVPTSTTDAIFSASSKNVTITAGATCRNLNFSTYSGQANFANNLTVVTNVTLNNSMTFTGTSNIVCTGNGGVLTSNGAIFSGGLTLQHSSFNFVSNLGDNWTILGNLSQAGANLPTLAGPTTTRTINIGGNYTGNIVVNNINVVINGNGTISNNINGIGSGGTFTINTTGTTTHSGIFNVGGLINFIYSAGTFNSTGTLGLANGSTLTNVSSLTFGNLNFPNNLGGQTSTINSNVNVTGNLTGTGGAGGNINGGFTVFLGGSINVGTFTLGGSASIEMNGSNNASIVAGSIVNNLNINKSSGSTVTLGSFSFGTNGRTFQLTSGIINPSTSTITIPNNISVILNNLTLWNLTIGGGISTVITQNVRNTIQNNLTVGSNSNVIFSGIAGWDCSNFLCSTPNRTITLQESIQYNTTNNVNLLGSDAQRINMVSSSPTNRAIWTLAPAANQSLVYVNGTRIDSSLGQTIWTFGGTLNDTLNWNLGSRPQTVAYTFIG